VAIPRGLPRGGAPRFLGQSMTHHPRFARLTCCGILLACLAANTAAQGSAPPADAATGTPGQTQTGTLQGRATATENEIPLSGLSVTVMTDQRHVAARTFTGPDGRFAITDLPPGSYIARVAADGFEASERPVTLKAGERIDVSFNLRLAGVVEHVEVVRPPDSTIGFGMIASIGARNALDSREVGGSALNNGDILAALGILPGVVSQANALSIRGGRTSQGRLQIDATDVSDRVTGESWFRLPGDAVALAEVFVSPAAAEYGRFGSGLTLLSTSAGSSRWTTAVNNLEPGLITKRTNPLVVVGLESVSPRLSVRGPLIKDTLFVAESIQLRYMSSEIQSRAQHERRRNLNLSNFTRFDAVASPRHTLTGSVGVYWQRLLGADVDTFTPPAAAADVRRQAYVGSARDSYQASATTVVETSATFSYMQSATGPHVEGLYVWAPDTKSGGFFASQDRRTVSWQWSEALSRSLDGPWGQHLLKVGADVASIGHRATSQLRPVEVLAGDGSTVGRIVYGASLPQDRRVWEASAFAQDRWQPVERVTVQAGVRLDRDGAFGAVGISPRAGGAVALDRGQRTILHGEAGVFRERVPLAATSFARSETRTEVGFGALPAAGDSAVTWVPTLGAVGPQPRNWTWDLGLDQRISQSLSLRVQVVRRTTSHELVVSPSGTGPTRALELSSTGQSRYGDIEVVARYNSASACNATLAYTRASSWGDYNAFSLMAADIRSTVVRPSAYTRTDGDIPHRVVGKAAFTLGPQWAAEVSGQWRTGFPWTPIDANLRSVGVPNQAYRYPSVAIVSFSLERRVRIWKLDGWIGLVVFNALNAFAPADVQTSLSSRSFGYYSNTDVRSIRLGFRMH